MLIISLLNSFLIFIICIIYVMKMKIIMNGTLVFLSPLFLGCSQEKLMPYAITYKKLSCSFLFLLSVQWPIRCLIRHLIRALRGFRKTFNGSQRALTGLEKLQIGSQKSLRSFKETFRNPSKASDKFSEPIHKFKTKPHNR